MNNPFRELYLAELTKKQKKIDVDKDGKIEGSDLAKLRKEEQLAELSKKQKKLDVDKDGKIEGSDLAKLRTEEEDKKPMGKGGKVETKKYSWGTMKTVHHGSDFSIPLHPEHHQAIAKLKDQQEHKFKDETGRHWTAKKSGEHVHFQGANNGGSTHVPAHTMSESHAPVAPGLDKKYIKGTPEHKAYKATKKPINGMPTGKMKEEVESIEEAKPGLYANINAKRKRIEAGSKERMRKPGSEGAPSAKDFKDAAKTANENYDDNRRGFGRRPREDDEYHVPDPTVKKTKVKNFSVKKEEIDLDEKLNVGGGAPVKGPNGVVSNTPPKKKPDGSKPSFVNSHEPRKSNQVSSAMGRLRARMDSARKVNEGRSDVVIHTTASSMDDNDHHITKLKDAGIFAQQGAGASHHIIVPREHEDTARKILAGHLKEATLSERNKENAEKRKEMDAAAGARYKVSNPQSMTPKPDEKHRLGTRDHNLATGRGARNEETVDEAMDRQARERAANEAERRAAAIANNPRIAAEVARRKALADAKKSVKESLLSRVANLAEAMKKCKSCGEKHEGSCSYNEEVLDEANHREFASQGKMHPDMAKHMSVGSEHDYYEHGTGDKVSGKVMHKSATEVHMKQTHDSYDPKKKGTVHKFKISDKLDEETISEGEGYTIHSKHTEADGTTTIVLKSPSGKMVTHKGKGSHKAVKQKYGIQTEETELDEKINMKKAEMGDVIKDFEKSDAPQFKGKSAEKRRQMAIAAKLSNEETNMNSFKSYMQEDLDEAAWPGTPEYKAKFGDAPTRGKVGSTTKTPMGTSTVTSTGVKHERDYEKAEKETSTPENQEKRGRGRPKGAASGARQKGSAAKSDDRYDSTGYKLHLPNKNR